MNVTVTARHMELTDAMRDHVSSGLQKVRHHFDKVIDVDVILSVEKHRHLAEFNLHANGLRINAKEASGDLYTSIDAAVHKLERQVKKFKDRIMRHQPRTSRELRDYMHQVIDFPGAEGEVETEPVSEPHVHRIVLREKFSMKPLSVDEAALQLQLQDDTFLVFSNADTHQVNVIYKLHADTYGLIEPPF